MRHRKGVGPLIVANQSGDSHGGIQRYVTRVSEELARRYQSVTLLEPFSSSRKIGDSTLKVITYPKGSRALEFFGMFSTYTLHVLRHRPDFSLASLWFPSGLVCALLPRFIRGPLAVLAHGSEIAPSRRGIRNRLMRFTFSRADAIFANSDYVATLLEEAGVLASVQKLPCGASTYLRKSRKSKRPIILSVGRLIARKGFDSTIMAMPEILKSVPDALYVIIGDGPYRLTLEKMAAELGICKSISFRGFVSERELAEAYCSAHCFSMPARRIGDDVEGFGIVYLEAASAELPTVAGADSGAGNAIVDGVTGLLVDGRDKVEIANAIILLLTNKILASEMGRRGRLRVAKHFSWARVASEIAQRMESR